MQKIKKKVQSGSLSNHAMPSIIVIHGKSVHAFPEMNRHGLERAVVGSTAVGWVRALLPEPAFVHVLVTCQQDEPRKWRHRSGPDYLIPPTTDSSKPDTHRLIYDCAWRTLMIGTA